jgi:hypothetical protein
MSFLDFDEFFRRIMTAPGSGGLEAAALSGQAAAEQASQRALAAQRDALAGYSDVLNQERDAAKRAQDAAVPAADKESTRLASEAELRKLLRISGLQFRRAARRRPARLHDLTGTVMRKD